MTKSLTKSMVIFAICAIVCVNSPMAAMPQVIQIDLGASVTAGFYITMLDTDGSGNGIWIDPGNSTGNYLTGPTGPALSLSLGATAPGLWGTGFGYGQILMSFTAASVGSFGAELTALTSNLPTNANPSIFGAATGPVNKVNIDLNRGIPAGTSVTITVDMNGDIPHFVAVMGGIYPTVAYDTGTGMLTIASTTFATETNAGDSFGSMFGFTVFTDTASFGSTPMRIVAQTNHWVGDIFPVLPGFDGNAAITDIGGTPGTITAKCGTTIYGPTGQNRSINIFFPDDVISTLFGAGVTAADLVAFVDSSEDDGATLTTGQNNFSVTGTRATFSYTFASPKDATLGPSLSLAVNERADGALPDGYELFSNYPNPFNPSTIIEYALPVRSDVTVTVFNVLGQHVKTLVNETQSSGVHSVEWDGADENGNSSASGVYYYRVKTHDFSKARKMVLLK